MTHNQVAYWDSIYRRENANWANYIDEYNAQRNEYWTHKNYNWNENMFGYQLFKDLTSNMLLMALLG